jgi:hypothetical protein
VSGSPYQITASGAVGTGLGNYTITYAPGQLAVTPATPTLSVSAPGGVFNGSPFPASVTISGSGSQNTPAASLEAVSPVLTYYVGSGTSGTNLGSTPPTQPGIYTVVASFPGSTDYSAAQSQPVPFAIVNNPIQVTLSLPSGSAVFGQALTLGASVNFQGLTPGGSITFYDGTTSLGTVPVNGSGQASLMTTALAVGGHSITASLSGDPALPTTASAPSTETVSQAATHIVLVPQPVFNKRHKLVSLGLKAEVLPNAPGAGVPTGTVTFEILKKVRRKVTEKVLGTMGLSGGSATLPIKPNRVLRKQLMVAYSGSGDFTASNSPTSVLTPALLKALVRPMIALYGHGR